MASHPPQPHISFCSCNNPRTQLYRMPLPPSVDYRLILETIPDALRNQVLSIPANFSQQPRNSPNIHGCISSPLCSFEKGNTKREDTSRKQGGKYKKEEERENDGEFLCVGSRASVKGEVAQNMNGGIEIIFPKRVNCTQFIETPSCFLFVCASSGTLQIASLHKGLNKPSKWITVIQLADQEQQHSQIILTIAHVAGIILCGTSGGHLIVCQLSRLLGDCSQSAQVQPSDSLTLRKQRISFSAITQIQCCTPTYSHHLITILTAHQQVFIAFISQARCELRMVSRLCTLNASLLMTKLQTRFKETKHLITQVQGSCLTIFQSSSSGVLKVWQFNISMDCILEAPRHENLTPTESMMNLARTEDKKLLGLVDSKMQHSLVPALLLSSLFSSTSVLEIRRYGALLLFISSDGYMNFVSLHMGHLGSFDSAVSYQNLERIKIFDPKIKQGSEVYQYEQYAGSSIHENIIYLLINKLATCPRTESVSCGQTYIKRIALDKHLKVASIQRVVLVGNQTRPLKFAMVGRIRTTICQQIHTHRGNCYCFFSSLVAFGAKSLTYYENALREQEDEESAEQAVWAQKQEMEEWKQLQLIYHDSINAI